jgi:hypothetical protein
MVLSQDVNWRVSLNTGLRRLRALSSWGQQHATICTGLCRTDGDAPRLWAPNGSTPGTAFTRCSVGDATAEAIWRLLQSRILVRRLTARNPFLVMIASDGTCGEFHRAAGAVRGG